MPTRILGVSGARPNFMKLEPVFRALEAHGGRFDAMLVHTGQHYDDRMSRVFFRELGLREPDIDLGVGSGSHAEQTAGVMRGIEPVLLERRPDLVLVVGDVNSTLAATITAVKLHIPVAHVEAGLRSFDRGMPEEINRLVTDALSEYLFTPSPDGDENLLREGVPPERIHRVGNVMIDTLLRCLPAAERSDVHTRLGLGRQPYSLLTLHRPGNVDEPDVLSGVFVALDELQRRLPVVFPVHPRTLERIRRFGLGPRIDAMPGLRVVEPLGYLDFLALQRRAALVLTDSGGVQEETTVLGVPCLTLRPGTERPITVTQGTNRIVGSDPRRILDAASGVLDGTAPRGQVPDLWDGRAAERIAAVLAERL